MDNFSESKIFAIKIESGESIISTQPSLSLQKYDTIICGCNNKYVTAIVVKVKPDGYLIFDTVFDREYIINKEAVAGIALGFIQDGKVIKYPDKEYFKTVKKFRRKYYLYKIKNIIKNDWD